MVLIKCHFLRFKVVLNSNYFTQKYIIPLSVLSLDFSFGIGWASNGFLAVPIDPISSTMSYGACGMYTYLTAPNLSFKHVPPQMSGKCQGIS